MAGPPPDLGDIYLTPGEAARLLRFTSARQLQALRDKGELPFVVLGHRTVRYPLSGLRDFIERNTVPRREA